MLLSPVTGGLLGLLPAALIAGGLSLTLLGRTWWGVPAPSWALGLAGLAVALLGLLGAPRAVRWSGRCSAVLLTDPPRTAAARRRREWIAGRVLMILQLAVLGGLAFVGTLTFIATMLGLGLGYGLGFVFVLTPVLAGFRWLADWRRHLAKEWSGVDVPTPYLLEPPMPAPGADGLYQVGKSLYKTSKMAQFNLRLRAVTADIATWREVLWRGVDPLVGGVLAVVPVVLVGYGIWGLALPRVLRTLFPIPDQSDWYGKFNGSPAAAVPLGLAFALIGVLIAPTMLRLHGRWTRVLLAPTKQAKLAQRVRRLTETRTDATDAQASELRRIERDLHDGAQARMVAVGMTLSTIEALMETDPGAARQLLGRTRESAATALRELRELVRGIHPPVLAERGLGDAVRALALDSALPVTVTVDLPGHPPAPLESAAYFAVAEALTNAARHAQATAVTVVLSHADGRLRLVIEDDGTGGADPSRGSGLRGIERRLGMFDGTVTVTSPRGGPTRLTMEIPCALSSPRISTS
jgi:signal transduction histidine kinase